MFRVEIYGRVRRAVLVEGRSQREVAREFGISSNPEQLIGQSVIGHITP